MLGLPTSPLRPLVHVQEVPLPFPPLGTILPEGRLAGILAVSTQKDQISAHRTEVPLTNQQERPTTGAPRHRIYQTDWLRKPSHSTERWGIRPLPEAGGPHSRPGQRGETGARWALGRRSARTQCYS